MWKPDSTPSNTWTVEISKPIMKKMSEPEYFFRTLLFAKKIGLEGHDNICNTYSDMYLVPKKHAFLVSLSENDSLDNDFEGRDDYWSTDFDTSIPYLTKKGTKKVSENTISVIERKGQSENLLLCSDTSDRISVVNIHVVWFQEKKNKPNSYRRQSHSNMLIFDHTQDKIYLFDPYGMTYSADQHFVYHAHQALKTYIEENFYYEYVGDIHEAARIAYPSNVVGKDGPQALQELCTGTSECHKSSTCQGWSAYFLLKLASDRDIDPVFTYTFMLSDLRTSMDRKRDHSGISGVMVTMLDVSKHIIDESDKLIHSHDKDIETCKKDCYLDIMSSYLKNRIPDDRIRSLTGVIDDPDSISSP